MKNIFLASISLISTVFIITLFMGLLDTVGRNDGTSIISVMFAVVASLVAAIVLLIWVIPIHLIFARCGVFNLGWYLVASLVPSIAFVYGLKPFGNDSASDLFIQASFCSAIGLFAALVFWYIAVHKPRITNGSRHGTAQSAAP